MRWLRREGDRCGPLITMLHCGTDGGGCGAYILDLTGLAFKAIQVATGAAAINNIGIDWIGHNVAAFTGADGMPISESNLTVITAAHNSGCAAVLLRAVDPIRKLVVHRDVIELRGWLVVPTA